MHIYNKWYEKIKESLRNLKNLKKRLNVEKYSKTPKNECEGFVKNYSKGWLKDAYEVV